MTKEQIEVEWNKWDENGYWVKDEIIDFAMYVINEAIAAEREACAKECDVIAVGIDSGWNRRLGIAADLSELANDCAEAIRARTTEAKNE